MLCLNSAGLFPPLFKREAWQPWISSAEENYVWRITPSRGIACIWLTHREDAALTSNQDNSASHPSPRVHVVITGQHLPGPRTASPSLVEERF